MELLTMIDDGEINEAENLMLEDIDYSNRNTMMVLLPEK